MKSLAALLVVCSVVLADAPQGSRAVKSLPLDGLSGVTLKNRTNSQYMPDRIIVKLMPRVPTSLSKSAFGIRSVDQVLSRVSIVSAAPMFPLSVLKQKPIGVNLSLFYEIRFSSPNDPFSLAEELSKLREVQYAEPSFIYPVTGGTFVPDDPFLVSSQWGLQQISAPAAWDISQGDTSIVIGIIDSGVDWSHPDLAANIWTNPGEVGFDALGGDKRANGVDDDNNGYVDDYHGWDFAGADWRNLNEDNDPLPTGDNNNHGTHVAGIAAATTNNGTGVASIGYKCRILPVKCAADNDTRANSSGYIIDGYRGITYAVNMGAKVVNCSWGGEGGSQFEQDIVSYATEHGALVVASAGNDDSDVFFSPAGYRGVLAVAATDSKDGKAVFSNFGDIVDVGAPGEGILSTIFYTDPVTHVIHHDYGTLSGTSMASPLAAGLAALVRFQFPHYNPLQIAEQVRVTSNPVVGLYRLGHGRINALKALTDSTLPSVRLQSFAVSDSPGGNGNATAQPAETLNIRCVVKNFLAPTSPGATLELSSLNSPYLLVQQASFPLGVLGTLDSVSNASQPFRVFVRPEVPQSYKATVQLTFQDGSFTDTQTFSFLVNPTYQTTAINDIQLTLTNDGRLGFFDFPQNSQGVGFVFNGENHLFEGGLIIATSSTRVVNVVRNGVTTGSQDRDFFSGNFFTLTTPGTISNQDGFTSFTDTTAHLENLVGVQVDAHSYAFSDPLDSRYIILRYDVKNRGTAPVKNAYIGIFLDWDLGNYNTNVSAFDSTRSLGYCYDASNTRREYVGIRALDSAVAFTSLVNDGSLDLSRAAKWRWLSGGFANAEAGPADIHHVISSGPFTINPGERQIIGFALVASDSSLANLQENADAAKTKWHAILKVVSVEDQLSIQPKEFRLEQNYPNPFNPRTSLEFAVPSSGFVSIKVYDVLGREVATLVNEVLQSGTHRVDWNASGFPSGVYFFRMQARQISGGQAGGFVATRKAVLMK